MDILSTLGAYLIGSFAASTLAEAIVYNRWNRSYASNWLLLALHLVGLPWTIILRLIKQHDWVNKIFLYFQLSQLPIHRQALVQALFNEWREKHRRSAAAPRGESIAWLNTRQVLAQYAFVKPSPDKDSQFNVDYVWLPQPPDLLDGWTEGLIRLARIGKDEYGVYAEYDDMT